MKALLSVSDKTGIESFAKSLSELGYDIVSTGGTYKKLKEAGLDVIEASDVTNFPECFAGRVKTLNPYIHGGILYKRDVPSQVEEARALNIESIDLVCVNLYPFKETIQRTDNFSEIIENIDIGGPTMVRSAAKNFNDVVVVTDSSDYDLVIENLKNEKNTLEFRRDLMIKAYSHTASYDCMIANYMNKRFNGGMGEKQFIVGSKVFNTRYGENPHQKGALYEFEKQFSSKFKTLKGEASFNNLTDIAGASRIAAAFGEEPAVCIAKHGNPCGFAIKSNLLESYTEALKCDPISAFGGVVAVNGTVDEELAMKMNEIFIEVIFAAHITPEAVEVFAKKKRIKLFEQGTKFLELANESHDFKRVDGGFVYQEADKALDNEIDNSDLKTKREASEREVIDMKIAWKVASLTKSNCVVYVKNSALVAVGMGMTSRVDAAKAAIRKAESLGLDVEGAVLASEAFFPFRDSIDEANKVGVKCVVQPGGSIRDQEVVDAANEHGMAMYFTGKRHFLH